MAIEVDNLQVKIVANAQTATSALTSLTNALKNVRKELTGMKDGVSVTDSLAKSFNQMNGALNTLSTSATKKLQKLANAIDSYTDALSRLRSMGTNSVAQSIQDVSTALNAGTSSATSETNTAWQNMIQRNTESLGQLSEIMGELQDKIGGVDQSIQDTGKHIQKTNVLFGKFLKSIARIALYRTIRSAIKSITEAFSEGLKVAYHYSEQTKGFNQLAQSLDRIKSLTTQLTNQIGAFWGELIRFVQPAIEWLIDKARKAFEWLTELFAALNGDAYYQRAVYEEQKWDAATKAAKKYKNQLLGIDELNNISTNKTDTEDYKKKYDLVPVSEQLRKVGARFQELKKEFEKQFGEGGDWHNMLLLGIGGLALGTVLLFTGHFGLGLGLILTCGALTGYEVATHWDELSKELSDVFETYRWLFLAGAISLTVLGAVLMFTPTHRFLGLGCILAGVAIGASEIAVNWELLYTDLQYAFEKFRPLFDLLGIGSMVVGAILLFTPTHFLMGLGLLVFGGFLTATTISFNWDSILENLKHAWLKIKNWWYQDVKSNINKAINWLETTLNMDINLDDKIAGLQTEFETLGTRKTSMGRAKYVTDVNGADVYLRGNEPETTNTEEKSFWDKVWNYPTIQKQLADRAGNALFGGAMIPETISDTAGFITEFWNDISSSELGLSFQELFKAITGKASGGLVSSGTLFYAGENGSPEWVGSMGGNTAVANTEQMTDAIYKAAYMGMSKALQENGGMNGYEPATMDDLFIAMRKKASNFNKRTGTAAFA